MMKKKSMIAVLAAVCALALTGCGQRADTTPVTEAQTQAPVQKITEKETEAVTEAVTEKLESVVEEPVEVVTEAVTEAATEAPRRLDLTKEEELAEETEYADYRTLYANDDTNVRAEPDKEEDNVYTSLVKGDEVTVTGETPNWYVISILLDDVDTKAYVYRDFLSETLSEDAGEEEAQDQGDETAEVTPQVTASTDEGVSAYAEAFDLEVNSTANLRVAPSDSATTDYIAVIPSGEYVTVLGETGDWYQVSYNGSTGYVHKNLVNN